MLLGISYLFEVIKTFKNYIMVMVIKLLYVKTVDCYVHYKGLKNMVYKLYINKAAVYLFVCLF